MKKDIVHGEKLGGSTEGFCQDVVIGDLIEMGGIGV